MHGSLSLFLSVGKAQKREAVKTLKAFNFHPDSRPRQDLAGAL